MATAFRRTSSPKPPSDKEVQKEEAKPSKPSRSGRDSKSPDVKKPGSKAKSRRERDEEKEREEEEQRQRDADEAAAAAAAAEQEKVFSPPPDPQLLKYIEEVNEKVMPLASTKDQVIELAKLVASKMGGVIARGQVAQFSWELPISQLKYERRSNVVPLGCLRAGIHIHRALLFKVLADRIGVGCTLERGDYNRAWNTVMIFDEDRTGNVKFPPKAYVVDLIHSPGQLIKIRYSRGRAIQEDLIEQF